MRPRLRVPAAVVAAAAAVASCGGKVVAPVTMPIASEADHAGGSTPPPGAATPGAAEGSVAGERVTPSRLFPELDGARGRVATEDGTERFLVDRMRLLVRADGSLERAAELLPGDKVQSLALPSRLGGGYLFHVSAGHSTEIWRASGWLAKLRPLTHFNGEVAAIVPGFDRLYLQLVASNAIVALDPWSGDRIGIGPLPVASSYGQLAFADGWRAVAETELRGPLTTFDAGATWRAVGLAERPSGVGIVDGNPAVLVHGGRYLIDARGGVTYHTIQEDAHARLRDDPDRRAEDEGRERRRPSPLGKRPLRAAVEDGWPNGDGTAVVARGGALARVSLRDGAVVAIAEDAYPERRSTCHAARLGLHDIGFLCGEREGPTTVYAYAPPLAMRPLLRYEKPRFAAASGNGALVLRGRCHDDPAKGDRVEGMERDAHWYCVRAAAGELREIRVQGADSDLGVERVVGLGDGRIVVLVPPRGGSAGTLSIIHGGSSASAPLVLPTTPESAARELKRGMWLDGFEERRPGVLGGWVEAGGPFLGVEVTLDGQVKAGELREESGGAVFGGRFAVALGEGGHAFETSDGGMSWAPFDLPDRDLEARAAPSRACGPVGCALPGWVRVGWGAAETPEDMKPVEAPPMYYPALKISPTLHFDCSVSSAATPPLAEKHPSPAPRPAPRRTLSSPGRAVPRDALWSAFRNTEAPALAADEYGVDNGPGPGDDSTPLRAYAWGKAGADWTRNGRWMVRFDDRFDVSGGLRSSAVTASLWPHQTEALEAVGTHPGYNGVTWSALLDPSGRSLLAVACRGQVCALYSVGDGQPVLQLRAAGAPGVLPRPSSGGAVRIGEAWFFLSQPSNDLVTLWRADLGVARQIGSYPRLAQRNGFEGPTLVRRAYGADVGLLIGATAEVGELWYVLPIDADSGALGEAIALGARDLTGTSLHRCVPEQDGWMVDLRFRPGTTTTNVELSNARARIEPVEMRMRLDPGRACVESLAAASDRFYPLDARGPAPLQPLTAPPAKKPGGDAGSVPLAVTEKGTGRRWGLACKLRLGEGVQIGGRVRL